MSKILTNNNVANIFFAFDVNAYAYNQVSVLIKNKCKEFLLFGNVDKECKSILGKVDVDISLIPDGSYDVFVYNYDGSVVDLSADNLFLQTKLFINRKTCLIK